MVEPFYSRAGITIYVGNNVDILPQLDTESVSAVVSDPPSGISFMNAKWDSHKGGRDQWIAWLASVLSECKRVMLPGAHALIWALPRTSGWTSMAIEDAGLDVRDCITHLFGSGFPKSADVSKHIDKMAGAEREVLGMSPNWRESKRDREKFGSMEVRGENAGQLTAPATPEAEQWQGWGTSLKPAAEFWYCARKPFKGTVAANVLAHGTGAINIDASRIASSDGFEKAWDKPVSTNISAGAYVNPESRHTVDLGAYKPTGRWPSNVILDEESARLLDAQSGERKSGGFSGTVQKPSADRVYTHGLDAKTRIREDREPSTGGASRYFKVVEQDENPCNHAEIMVQYDCNCEAVEGDKWVKRGHQASIQAESDTPPRRDTTGSPSGTASAPAPSWHTSTNGSSTTAPSLTATRSTTSTATSRTTASRTCNCSTPQPTSASTQAVNSEMVNGGSHALSVASSSPSTPSTGTSAEKAGHSTDVAERVISARSLPINNGDAPASRFLYVPKASRRERNMGLPEGETSSHPTVKPLALMRYLIQMVTPPGGIVLDPFMGSGSTLVAAAELGFHAIGIELSEEYAEIAARRVDHALNERAGRLPGLEVAD